MEPTIAAYIAGVIDGEGCIRIGKFPAPKRTTHGFQFRVIVEITMCERQTIEFIAHQTNRNIQLRKLKSGKTAYKVVFYNSFAYNLLIDTLPFIQGKKLQAEACIECHKLMPGRGKDLTIEAVKEINRIRDHVSWLKTLEALRC